MLIDKDSASTLQVLTSFFTVRKVVFFFLQVFGQFYKLINKFFR